MKNTLKLLASTAVLASCLTYSVTQPINSISSINFGLTEPAFAAGPEAKSTADHKSKTEGKKVAEIYTFKAKALDGKEIELNRYKGDVMLIVNTASECGFTPQYEGLEALNKKYAARGLKVLGFPCNQFGAQEPGDSKAIASFCHKNYGVDFQMFEKIDVNGKDADPIYRYLTGSTEGKPIKWNFTKFLIDRHGNIVKRFDSGVDPKDLAPEIEKQL